MPKIARTILDKSGFETSIFEADETATQYRLHAGQEITRKLLKKSEIMKATADLGSDTSPVFAYVWHLPDDEEKAKGLLVKSARLRLEKIRQKVAAMVEAADKGEAFLNSLGV